MKNISFLQFFCLSLSNLAMSAEITYKGSSFIATKFSVPHLRWQHYGNFNFLNNLCQVGLGSEKFYLTLICVMALRHQAQLNCV